MTMTLPYLEPLVPREPGERLVPEPPRRGEPGGPPCGICTGRAAPAVWSDDNWTLHPPVGGSLPGSCRSATSPGCTSTGGASGSIIPDASTMPSGLGRNHTWKWAPPSGGRPAERPGREARAGGGAHRGRDVT